MKKKAIILSSLTLASLIAGYYISISDSASPTAASQENRDTPSTPPVKKKPKKIILSAQEQEKINRQMLQHAERGDMDSVAKLLARGAQIDAQYEPVGNTCLVIATWKKNWPLVMALLNAGANPNLGTFQDGHTPIMLALRSDHMRTVRALLRKGALVSKKDNNGNDARSFIGHHNKERYRALFAEERLLRPTHKLNQRLLKACLKGDLDAVKASLAQGASLHSKTLDGLTPLHIASQRGNRELLEYLLSRGADVLLLDDQAKSALDHAVDKQHTTLATLLTEKIKNTPRDAKAQQQLNTTLYHCAIRGDRAGVKRILSAGAQVDAQFDPKGDTSLIIAIWSKHASLAFDLIRAGADVNIASSADGHSPLMLALRFNLEQVARELVRRGATVDSRDKHGVAVLDFASPERRAHFASLLQEEAKRRESRVVNKKLLDGIQNEDLDIIQQALREGAQVNSILAPDPQPLILACQMKNQSIIDALLKAGAQGDSYDETNNTPLYVAIERGDTQLARLLISHGADVNRTRAGARTPLMEAVLAGDAEMVKLLVEKGAFVNARHLDRRTALGYARSKHLTELVSYLRERGAHL